VIASVCALHVDCAPSSDPSPASFPDAERMMTQASLPREDERGGFVLETHRHTMTARVDASPAIEVDTRGAHARVERVGARIERMRLRGNVLRSSGDVERFVFARGEEIEELALLSRPSLLAYRFVVPDRFHLRALSSTLVQVDDAAGDPWLRMRADRAWSADGREVSVGLSVEGDVVSVTVPSDARFPLLVDPTWAAATSPAKAREYHTATLLGDGRVLIAGGGAFAAQDTAEIYDPRTGIFTALEPAKMTAPRVRHAAAMLPSGRVLLVGGGGGGADAEIFDPKTSTFTAVAAKTTMSSSQSLAARLLDGRVLVKGFIQQSAEPPPVFAPAAEIFDPTTGTSTVTNGGTLDPRGVMTTLADGRVLLAGECAAEVFDPQNSTWTPATGLFCGQPEKRAAALLHDGRVVVTQWPGCAPPGNCTLAQIFDPVTGTFGALSP
jgi:hypothetical protein